MIKQIIKLSENNLIPDYLIRFGIRHLLKKRLASLVDLAENTNRKNKINFINMMDQAKIAEVPELANQQHYDSKLLKPLQHSKKLYLHLLHSLL